MSSTLAMPDSLVLSVQQPVPRNRGTTFLRLILAIPHLLVGALWGVVAILAVIPAWFAIVFTGRYPAGLYEFVAGWVRYAARINLYTFLAVDPFPPFSGGPDNYPVQLQVPHPPQYNRVKTLLRILYIIPAYIVAVIVGYLMYIVGFVDWLIIVITGAQPPGMQNLVLQMLGWGIRVTALFTLVSEDYGLQIQMA